MNKNNKGKSIQSKSPTEENQRLLNEGEILRLNVKKILIKNLKILGKES